MKTKNQRIADTLQKLAESLKDAAFNVEMIKELLLTPDHVTAGIPNPSTWTPDVKSVTVVKPLSDNAGRGTLGQAIVDSNKEKNDRTEAINQNAANIVAERKLDLKFGAVTPANNSELTFLSTSGYLQLVHSNSQLCYYKRIKGLHTGSILSQDRKTGKIIDHKYRVSNPLDKQLCMVSKDQDGINYVDNVVRTNVKLRVKQWNANHRQSITPKLVRYYRPGRQQYPPNKSKRNPTKTFCAVYLKDRLHLCK